jgi:hypothetical protein
VLNIKKNGTFDFVRQPRRIAVPMVLSVAGVVV